MSDLPIPIELTDIISHIRDDGRFRCTVTNLVDLRLRKVFQRLGNCHESFRTSLAKHRGRILYLAR